MAKSNPRSARGAAPARAAAKSKKAAADIDLPAEEAGGMGYDAGMAILTALLLVAAIVMVDMMKAKMGGPGTGMFF
ncbi:MAG TPA: hypothetical protein VF414_08200 [Thermoanaerobaculia bacterium]